MSALPKTPAAFHEAFALDQLRRAALATVRLEKLKRGSLEYGAEAYTRKLALEAAQYHMERLRALGTHLSAEIHEAIAALGLPA